MHKRQCLNSDKMKCNSNQCEPKKITQSATNMHNYFFNSFVTHPDKRIRRKTWINSALFLVYPWNRGKSSDCCFRCSKNTAHKTVCRSFVRSLNHRKLTFNERMLLFPQALHRFWILESFTSYSQQMHRTKREQTKNTTSAASALQWVGGGKSILPTHWKKVLWRLLISSFVSP